jgi:hypothetical protein
MSSPMNMTSRPSATRQPALRAAETPRPSRCRWRSANGRRPGSSSAATASLSSSTGSSTTITSKRSRLTVWRASASSARGSASRRR